MFAASVFFLEPTLGAHWPFADGWRVHVVASTGLTAALGSPLGRETLALEWAPAPIAVRSCLPPVSLRWLRARRQRRRTLMVTALQTVRTLARMTRAITTWLVAHAIDKALLSAQGKGPDEPVASNDTGAGRQENRRVDFNIR